MRTMKRCVSLYLFACALVLLPVEWALSQSTKTIRVTEVALRRMATRTVLPEFPREAKNRGAKGVSVAELEVDQHGAVAEVQVLEAPDDSIKAAVADALKQWQFKISTLNGEPVRIRGKLTFYYVNDGAAARVEDPKLSE